MKNFEQPLMSQCHTCAARRASLQLPSGEPTRNRGARSPAPAWPGNDIEASLLLRARAADVSETEVRLRVRCDAGCRAPRDVARAR